MSHPCRARFSSLRRGSVLVVALWSAGCEKKPVERTAVATTRVDWPAPMKDASGTCADVADLRVCFGAPGGVSVVPRLTPAPAISAAGYRCAGDGEKRTCRDRALDVGAFEYEDGHWIQRHPRFPDSGEWECADPGGAVLCRGGERAAGTAPAGSDAAFHCAPRIVSGKPTAERLCMDWSPDTPHATPRGVRCHFDSEAGIARVCDDDPDAHAVADECDATKACLPGLVCASGRCVPREREPTCWLDADCGGEEKVCRFGVCTARSP